MFIKKPYYNFLTYIIFISISICIFEKVFAEVIIDGTLTGGNIKPIKGPVYEIPENYGFKFGENLFHSFKYFNLTSGHEAIFTSNPESTINNVISRVTGGEESRINGKISSKIPGANFFFLNPAGIFFGPDASIDVDGSFHASTSDSIEFEDGKISFFADPTKKNSFSSMSPESFGFIGNNPGKIEMNGKFQVSQNQTLSMIGGDIEIKGDSLLNHLSTLSAPGGRINIASIGSNGKISIKENDLIVEGQQYGEIKLYDSLLNVSYDYGGDVFIKGRSIDFNNTYMKTTTIEDGGFVLVSASENINFENSTIDSITYNGKGNDINLESKNIYIDNSNIVLDTLGKGDSGNLHINVNQLLSIKNGTDISLKTHSEDIEAGSGGYLNIYANNISMESSLITTRVIGKGSGGNIRISVDNDIKLNNLARIELQTLGGHGSDISINCNKFMMENLSFIALNTYGKESGGDINIKSNELTYLDKSAIVFETRDKNENAGNSGICTIDSKKIYIINGSQINGKTYGSGNGGDINLTASDLIEVYGSFDISNDLIDLYGSLDILTDLIGDQDNFDAANGSEIATSAQKESFGGNSGNIFLKSKEINIYDHGSLNSSTYSLGNAGNIMIEGEQLNVLSNGMLSSSTYNSGNAGNTVIDVEKLKIQSQSLIESCSISNNVSAINSTGNSGNIFIGKKILKNEDNTYNITEKSNLIYINDNSNITTISNSIGGGGDINIKSNEIILNNIGIITSNTYGSGNAGNIYIEVDKLNVEIGGILAKSSKFNLLGSKNTENFSSSKSSLINDITLEGGNAGNIIISKSIDKSNDSFIYEKCDSINIGVDSEISTDTDTIGNGGENKIYADEIELKGSISAASTGEGNAGNIIMDVNKLDLIGQSSSIKTGTVINGDAGNIKINSIDMKVEGRISSHTEGKGNAGDIIIEVNKLDIQKGKIFSGASPNGVEEALHIGEDGNIIIENQNFEFNKDLGNGGDIFIGKMIDIENDEYQIIEKSDLVNVGKESFIISQNVSINGNSGNITIGTDKMYLEEGISTSTYGHGNAGNILLEVNSLQISNNAHILSASYYLEELNIYPSGNSGNIFIGNKYYRDNLLLKKSDEVIIDNCNIYSGTLSEGNAGEIKISSKLIDMKDGTISSGTSDKGNGGNIVLEVNELALSGSAKINISSDINSLLTPTKIGKSGDLFIGNKVLKINDKYHILDKSELITIKDKSVIGSLCQATNADGGDTILAANKMIIESHIVGGTTGSGNSGNIILEVNELTLSKNGTISTSTMIDDDLTTIFEKHGNAGNIYIGKQIEYNNTYNIIEKSDLISINDDTSIGALCLSNGSAGQVWIASNEIKINGIIATGSMGEGDAGNIIIEVDDFHLLENGNINAGGDVKNTLKNIGKGGNIYIGKKIVKGIDDEYYISDKCNMVKFDKNTGITLLNNSIDNAGNICISTRKMNMEGIIASTTVGIGRGGDIIIETNELYLMNGANIVAGSGNQDLFLSENEGDSRNIDNLRLSENVGSSGDIIIGKNIKKINNTYHILDMCDYIKLEEESVIEASTMTNGNGGKIWISSKKIDTKSSIKANTEANGNAGTIIIEAEELFVSGGGIYAATRDLSLSFTSENGDGGIILIGKKINQDINTLYKIEEKSDSIRMNDSIISSVSISTGNSGSIFIGSKNIQMNNSDILSSTLGSGKAGNITLEVDTLSVDDSSIDSTCGIEYKEEILYGNSGNILIGKKIHDDLNDNQKMIEKSDFIYLNNDASITTSTITDSDAGEIEIETSKLYINNNSTISSESLHEKNGGAVGSIVINSDESIILQNNSSISIKAEKTNINKPSSGNISLVTKDLLYLYNSEITTSVNGGMGNGGDILIDPLFVLLNDSEIEANAFEGNGGNISIKANYFFKSLNSRVEASSNKGIDGEIEINTPEEDVGSKLSILPSHFLDASSLIKTSCTARNNKDVSQMYSKNRDGVPISPDDWISSALFPFHQLQFANTQILIKLTTKISTNIQNGNFASAIQLINEELKSKNFETKEKFVLSVYLSELWKYMGHYNQALSELKKAFTHTEKSDNTIRAIVYNKLGDLYLTLGKKIKTDYYLKKALAEARLTSNNILTVRTLNNLGNYYALTGKYFQAMQLYDESLNLIDNLDVDDSIQYIVTYLNKIRTKAFIAGDFDISLEMLTEIYPKIESIPLSYQKGFLLISYSLLIKSIINKTDYLTKKLIPLAIKSLSTAITISIDINSSILSSYAFGYMGYFNIIDKDLQKAGNNTRRAILYSQYQYSPELEYLWQWQTGKIKALERDIDRSIKAYSHAIKILNPIRREFFSGYKDNENRFERHVKPVFLEMAQLLINQYSKNSDVELKNMVDLIENMKVAEIQSFYHDECLTSRKSGEVEYKVSNETAVIYPVQLKDHLLILLHLPSKIQYVVVPVQSNIISQVVQQFRNDLENFNVENLTFDELDDARQIYEWLITPIEPYLYDNNIKTLLLVPDSSFSLIPFSALNDGNQFLIEKFSLVTIPAFSLTNFQESKRISNKVLLNGLSEGKKGFSSLPGVSKELVTIKNIMGGKILINENYTKENILNELQVQEYDIIHMATHGVFYEHPEESYILTYDGKMSMNDIENLITFSRLKKNEVNMITLSACQTAQGNERAAFGFAGIALKAGVKSALATLWSVDDNAAFLLIEEFYKNLKIKNTTKAQALQIAQKKLILSNHFNHPIFWSPFILIGNWK